MKTKRMSMTLKKVYHNSVNWVKSLILEFKRVPAWMVALSAVATVLMNILANKGLFTSEYLSLDAGFTISFIMFLVMDITTQRYGGKASLAVTLFDVASALLFAGIMYGVAQIPESEMSGWGLGKDASDALNGVIGNSPAVVGVSLFAFLCSSVTDIFSNITFGKWMEKSKTFGGNTNKRGAKGFFIYFVRAYGSTFLSQLVDNCVFQFIAYNFIFTWFSGTQLSVFIGASVGAVAELIMELAFAPIGYLATTKKDTSKNLPTTSN